jgi:hypothetical protein
VRSAFLVHSVSEGGRVPEDPIVSVLIGRRYSFAL